MVYIYIYGLLYGSIPSLPAKGKFLQITSWLSDSRGMEMLPIVLKQVVHVVAPGVVVG